MPFKVFHYKLRTLDPAVRTALLVFVTVISTGTLTYHFLEGWSFFDSLYFSVITLTTIGYGDLHPTQPLAKLFTMFYALGGVGLLLYLFSTLTKHLFESEKHEIERLEHDIEDISDMLHHQKLPKIDGK
jgi:hypothetical protein